MALVVRRELRVDELDRDGDVVLDQEYMWRLDASLADGPARGPS
jgi:hypothetical protein